MLSCSLYSSFLFIIYKILALELARKAYRISNNTKEIADKITHVEAFEAISETSEPLKSFIYEPLLSPLIALLSTFKVVTLRAFDHILASSIGGTLTALSGKSN